MRHRGFTLIEVVIAIALVIALLGAAWTLFFQLLDAREHATRVGRQQLAATTLIERLERDLVTSLVGDQRAGSGVRGDERGISVLTRSVPASLAERGPDAPTVFADLERAEYRFDEAAGQVRAARHAVSAGSGSVDPPVELGGPLHLVRFRYHDGSGWRSSFDSLRADRLPIAVEVAVWFEPWELTEPSETEPFPNDDPDELFADDEAALADRPPDDLPLARSDEPVPQPDRVRVIPIPDADSTDSGDELEPRESMEAGP